MRVDEVGRAEAVAYEAMEPQADPHDPTTGFVVDQYSRRRGTVREYWEWSRWLLPPQVANAAYAEQAEDVAATAVGRARRSCRSRMSPYGSCRSPRSRTLPRRPSTWCGSAAGEEVARESWSVSMRFSFLVEIPAELIVRNPMGIVISFPQGDRIVTSGDQR